MTVKYYCDVCGKETKNHDNLVIQTTLEGGTYDICDECIAKLTLKDFIKKLLPNFTGTFEKIIFESYDYFKGEE